MKFVCGMCGKEHDSIAARAKCEMKCIAAVEKAEAEAKKQALAEEKDSRYKDVLSAWNTYVKKRNEYVKDYGVLFINDGFSVSRLL